MEWTFLNLFLISGLIMVLTGIHELGHIVAARQLGMRIFKIGAALSPIPHVFVAAQHPKEFWKKFIYLMAGSAITITLFSIAMATGLAKAYPWIYIAFAFQLIIEANPFYSDFTIITGKHRDAYIFSSVWYIHFVLWMSLILLLIHNN